jgi:hypothetical protein
MIKNIFTVTAVILFSGLSFASPKSDSKLHKPLGKPFQLRVGEMATFQSGIQIKLNQVLENSLCPKDVQCVWAGKVLLEVQASVNENSQLELQSGREIGRSITLSIGTLEGENKAPIVAQNNGKRTNYVLEMKSFGEAKDTGPATFSFKKIR